MRKCSADTVNALKTAFKRVVADLGGLEAAAACTRVGKSQLFDYGNVDCDKAVPADVIVDLEAIGGHPHVTAALAAAAGFELMRIGTRPVHELRECLARISDDNGRLFGNALRLLSGHKMGAEQRAAIERDLLDVVMAGREALAALQWQQASDD